MPFIDCSPQTNGKALLLKSLPAYFIEQGGIEVVLTYRIFISTLHGTEKYSAYYWRKKANTNQAANPFIYNDDLPSRYASAIVA